VVDRCQTLNLSALANTDPFNAPFGVVRPGKFLFTGLRTGRQELLQVPFSILDPAINGGRGMVVLQGGEASGAAAHFPKEVTIPVHQKGKRIFFLGGVAGWTGGDQGSGKLKAVAEFVIQYTNGQKQIVPLIPGKTLDDWAGSPNAAQTIVAIRGEPWHLNVCAVALSSNEVQDIVFRDLGTISAPLLAAVTIEN
jgi:hypothetical protein